MQVLIITLDQCSSRKQTCREYLNLKYAYLMPVSIEPILLNIGYISRKETIILQSCQILMSN